MNHGREKVTDEAIAQDAEMEMQLTAKSSFARYDAIVVESGMVQRTWSDLIAKSGLTYDIASHCRVS